MDDKTKKLMEDKIEKLENMILSLKNKLINISSKTSNTSIICTVNNLIDCIEKEIYER